MNCVTCSQPLGSQSSGFIVCAHCGTVNIGPASSGTGLPIVVSSPTATQGHHPSAIRKHSLLLACVALLLVILGGGTASLVAYRHFVSPKKVHTVDSPQDSQPKTSKTVAASPVKPPTTHTTAAKPPASKPKPTTPAPPQYCYQVAGPSARSTSDLPDDDAGYQVHIIYALPSDGADHQYDFNGSIARSVSAWNNWLCNRTSGRPLRLDTRGGVLDVTFVRLNASDNTIKTGSSLPWATNPNNNPYVREDIQRRLTAAGFNSPNKLYAVYYDGTSNHSCGGGAWPPLITGHVAAEYMHGGDPAYPNCNTNHLATDIASPTYFDFDILHEIMHTLGFVATCAPNQVAGGHASDSNSDLMYGGGNLPWTPSLLDINNNDYYNTKNPNCLDLARSAFLVNGSNQLPPGW